MPPPPVDDAIECERSPTIRFLPRRPVDAASILAPRLNALSLRDTHDVLGHEIGKVRDVAD